VNIPPRGPISPLGAKGAVKNGPQVDTTYVHVLIEV
jgi:hypothetical protein